MYLTLIDIRDSFCYHAMCICHMQLFFSKQCANYVSYFQLSFQPILLKIRLNKAAHLTFQWIKGNKHGERQ